MHLESGSDVFRRDGLFAGLIANRVCLRCYQLDPFYASAPTTSDENVPTEHSTSMSLTSLDRVMSLGRMSAQSVGESGGVSRLTNRIRVCCALLLGGRRHLLGRCRTCFIETSRGDDKGENNKWRI